MDTAGYTVSTEPSLEKANGAESINEQLGQRLLLDRLAPLLCLGVLQAQGFQQAHPVRGWRAGIKLHGLVGMLRALPLQL